MPSLFTESVGQQTARVGTPCQVGVAERRQLLGCGEQRLAAIGRVEVARELENSRVVDGRIAVEISAGCEDEQCAADGGVAFVVRERYLLSGDVRGDDEVDVRQRIRRRSRAPRRGRRCLPRARRA
jgi:hypothetical protein